MDQPTKISAEDSKEESEKTREKNAFVYFFRTPLPLDHGSSCTLE